MEKLLNSYVMQVLVPFFMVIIFGFLAQVPVDFGYVYAPMLFFGLSALIAGVAWSVEPRNKKKLVAFILPLAAALYVITVQSDMVNAGAMANSLKVKEVSKKDIHFDKQRVVTKDMAVKIANKILGGKVDGVQISSQYKLNKKMSSIQEVNGSLVWVMPLDYLGFLKWVKQDTVPGYVTVSATDPEAPAKLTLKPMVVSEGAFFFENIERLAYFRSGFKKVSTHFEVDEKGHPFYISLVLEPAQNFTIYHSASVIVTDAMTGISTEVSYKEAQEKYPWVDRLTDINVIDQKIHWYGKYQEGFWSYVLSGENVNVPTDYKNRELWIAHVNGHQVYFTGMTSSHSEDQSLVEGVVVDTKTGETQVFDLSGVMDEAGAVAALDSALGADSTKWEPVLPQPFMVRGEFFWGAAIVSNANIFQKVGLVNGKNQSEIYFAKSYPEALSRIGTNSSEKVEGFVKIKKSTYLKLLKVIKEVEDLKKELQ